MKINERRKNWKQDISKMAQKKQKERNDLLLEKELIAEQLRSCGSNFALYDDLKAKQRGIIAKLAQLHY